MLEELGEAPVAGAVMGAIEAVLSRGDVKTRDLGGSAGTDEVGNALVEAVSSIDASDADRRDD